MSLPEKQIELLVAIHELEQKGKAPFGLEIRAVAAAHRTERDRREIKNILGEGTLAKIFNHSLGPDSSVYKFYSGPARGTIYVTLIELEDAGFVVSNTSSEKDIYDGFLPRRYYKLTDQGSKHLSDHLMAQRQSPKAPLAQQPS